MSFTKLNILINSFTESDWKQYVSFAKSRYSSNSELFRISNHLRKCKTTAKEIGNSSKDLYKSINSKASTKAFSNTLSILCGHIEAFMVWEELSQSKGSYQTFLAAALAKRNIKPAFRKTVKGITDFHSKHPNHDFWKYWNAIKTNHHYYFNSMSIDISEGEEVLRKSYSDLKHFHQSQMHFLAVEINNRALLTDEDWSNEINYIDQLKFSHRYTEIYDLLIELKKSKDLSIYLEIWNILTRQYHLLPAEIRYTILIHLISFASYMSKTNLEHEGPKNVDLYFWGMQTGILFENGSIPLRRFFNMIHFMSVIEGHDKVLSLIHKYAEQVDLTMKKEVINIGTALIEFQRENYDTALDLLEEVSFKNQEITVMSKVLMIKIYYTVNSNDYEFMDRQITNFRYFVKVNSGRFSDATIKSLKRFAFYVQKMIDGENKNALIEMIKSEELLLGRPWLLQILSSGPN